MEITVLKPKGYCAGVINAIEIAKKTKANYRDKEVCIFGMLVHNEHVINELSSLGIKTIRYNDNYLETFKNDVNDNTVVIFTAHGHDEQLNDIAKSKNCIIVDAICPKVKANLDLIKKELKNNGEIIYIGQKGHPETISALSLSKKVILYDVKQLINYQFITNKHPLVINQTTLNFSSLTAIHEDIKQHIPGANIINEICGATRLRQESLSNLPSDTDLIIIVGDKASSNTNKLFEIAKKEHSNIASIMIDDEKTLDTTLLLNKNHIVISSGSSTPPDVIDAVINKINSIK